MENVTCVEKNTQHNITGSCSCKAGFYGQKCEFFNTWYLPLNYSAKIYHLLVSSLFIIWVIIRLHDLSRRGKLEFNRSIVSIILNFIACMVLIFSQWFDSNLITITHDNLYIIAVFAIVIIYSPIILWLSATSLIAGFWYEILRRVNRTSKITTVVTISSSVLIIVCAVIGMVIAVYDIHLITIALVLIFGPLILGVVVTTIITILVNTITIKRMSRANKEKKQWASRTLLLICCAWVLCMLCIVFSLAAGSSQLMVGYGYIFSFIISIALGIVSLGLMGLSDQHFSSWRHLFKRGGFDISVPATTRNSTTTSTSTATDDDSASPRLPPDTDLAPTTKPVRASRESIISVDSATLPPIEMSSIGSLNGF